MGIFFHGKGANDEKVDAVKDFEHNNDHHVLMGQKPKKRKPPLGEDIHKNSQGFVWGSHYAQLVLNPEKWCLTSSADLRDTLPSMPLKLAKHHVPLPCNALFLQHMYSLGRYILLLVALLCIVFVCGMTWSKGKDSKEPSSTGWTIGIGIAGFGLTYVGILITQIRADRKW